jgi:hypothetical protein
MPLWKSLYPNFVIDYNLMRNNSVLTKLDIFCVAVGMHHAWATCKS